MAASDILQLVLERRRAFEEFIPRSFWIVEFENTDSIRREILDGIWGRSPDNRPEGPFRGTHFEELLPPTTKGGRWSLDRADTGVDASDLSFWLDADALYLVERRDNGYTWRIHFRHLSTNEVHRLAFAPFIDFHGDDREVWEECEIVCYEERLSVEFYDNLGPDRHRRTAVVVIDWITGQILLPYTVASDGAFLTKDLFILAQVGWEDYDSQVTFNIWSLTKGRLLWSCKMPTLSKNFSIRFLKRPASNKGPNCPTRYAKIFVPDPRVSILTILFVVASPNYISYPLVLSIHSFLRKCHSLLDERSSEVEDTTTAPVFKWEGWGPGVTRWLPSGVEWRFGSRMVYGARMLAYLVVSGEPSEPESGYNVLLDFNPRPIRRAAMDLEGDKNHVSILTERHETTWNELGNNMESSLAYRQWVSTEESLYRNLNFEANTILARLKDYYHCYSFLPRGDTEPPEPSLAGRL